MRLNIFLFFIYLAIVVAGCSSSKEPQKNTVAKMPVQKKDRSQSLQHFIDGSLLESKGEYAQAILEYQDALRYDQDPAIYFALAKNYSALRKHALAAENGREAVLRDSTNINYRESLAEIYIKAGQLEQAQSEYQAILALDSNYTNAIFRLAQIVEHTQPTKALALYERLLQRNGPTWEVLFQIAELNVALHRFDKAAETFEQMVKLDPSNAMLKQNLAEIYARSEQFDKALSLYTELLELNPNNIEIRGALAELHIQKNDWSSARTHFERMLKSDSLTADTRFRIGSAYFSQIQKDSSLIPAAIGQFKTYLQKFNNDWRPMVYLGFLSRMIKDDSTAQYYFDKSTKTASWNPETWWQLGWLYYDKQKFDEAIQVMERAKQVLPNEPRVHLLLGITYSRTQQHEKAIVALERSLELNPADVNALSSLGLSYDALKKYSQCDTAYERALRLDAQNPLVLNNYAYSLAERGMQLQRAEEMSRRSLEKDSTNASYLDTYGWILFKLGKFKDAERYIKKAVDTGDSSAAVLEHLGDVYYRLNQPEKAKEYWSRALELDLKNSSLKEKVGRGKL